MLQPDTLIVRKSDLPSTAVDCDTVILNLTTNSYVGLDKIGTRIWELLDKPISVNRICQIISQQFHGAPDVIACDVMGFVQTLSHEHLVDVVQE